MSEAHVPSPKRSNPTEKLSFYVAQFLMKPFIVFCSAHDRIIHRFFKNQM